MYNFGTYGIWIKQILKLREMVVFASKLLDDQLPGLVVCEIVGLEHVGLEERLQVLDADLPGLLGKILLVNLNNLLLSSVPKVKQ